MRYILSLCVLVLARALPAGAEAPAVSLTIILTPERVKAAELDRLTPVLAAGRRGTVVVAEPNNLFAVHGRKRLFDAPTPVSDCTFTPDGALLVVSGRKLGYCAGGRFHPQIDLPQDAMRLAIGPDRIYVYGGVDEQATAIYVVEPQRGHAKLCTVPAPVGAVSAAGDTLFFSLANDVYRLAPGGEINLICHVPGPAITSLAAADTRTLYLLVGRTLYVWRADTVAIISEGLGDVARWQDDRLYVLDTEKQSLVKLEHLPGPEGTPEETP